MRANEARRLTSSAQVQRTGPQHHRARQGRQLRGTTFSFRLEATTTGRAYRALA